MAELTQTLLAMTQDILGDINGDEVSSINDTIEAEQVSQIIVDTYFDLIALRMIPEHQELTKLTGLSDSTKPNYLRLPSDVVRLENDYFFYNVADTGESLSYGKVCWLEPEIFLERQRHNNPDDSTVEAVLDINAGTTIYIHNDVHPTYFTSFDDLHFVCNSFDSSVDSTLQTSKTQALVIKAPSFSKADSSVPDIDLDYFPYLKSEARSRAFAWLHKTVDQKAEQIARRHKTETQTNLLRLGSKDRLRHYGRT